MSDLSPLDASRLISANDDRRTFQRFSMNMLAFVRLPTAPQPSMSNSAAASQEALYTLQPVPIKDLSMTGLFFSSRLSYPEQSEVQVRLYLDGVEFSVPAVVERRVRISNLMFGYGVNFRQSQTSKPLRVALASFLLRQDCAVKPAGVVVASRRR